VLNKNAKFDFECPGCHHRFLITIKQAQGKSVICPNCHRSIEIRGDLAKKLKGVERSMKDFKID
jgi:transcription elongation factor Elf1